MVDGGQCRERVPGIAAQRVLIWSTTQVVQQTRVEAQDKPVNRIERKQGATVDDPGRSLQTIGASARDVISILQAMKSAGALEAEIEVL